MPKHIFADAAQFQGYTCAQMRAHYNFPAHLDGTGQTIGIAEWSSGYAQNDLDAFCSLQGLPRCVPQYIVIDGGQNTPDAECTLDIEIAHGMAPGAKIRLYEAPSGPNYQTFWEQVLALLTYVLHDPARPSVLSISYGDGERDWTQQQVEAADALIGQLVAAGTTVLISSGDQGALGLHNIYADPNHTPNADAPAVSSHAVAVGGTTVPQGAPEGAWNRPGWGATGGGVSVYLPKPGYQNAVNHYGGRGIPDFSLLADPQTGWQIVFQAQVQPIGGTSASAPAAAALIACVNEARAQMNLGPVGDILSAIYEHTEVFRPVTTGDNSFMGVQGYAATAPWSPCCGLGVPDAAKFVALFLPEEVVPVTQPTQIPVFVDGKEQSFQALLQDGYAYCPIVDTAKALGFTATRDLQGVYITTPKAP